MKNNHPLPNILIYLMTESIRIYIYIYISIFTNKPWVWHNPTLWSLALLRQYEAMSAGSREWTRAAASAWPSQPAPWPPGQGSPCGTCCRRRWGRPWRWGPPCGRRRTRACPWSWRRARWTCSPCPPQPSRPEGGNTRKDVRSRGSCVLLCTGKGLTCQL